MTATLEPPAPADPGAGDASDAPRGAAPKRSMFDPTIAGPAAKDALRKLDPRTLARNPVMFVVEIGSVLTTVIAIREADGFAALVALWLWFTVLFANFAEAVAEGRGKAQAETLRRTRTETTAFVRLPDGSVVERTSTQLVVGDLCVVDAGQTIPGDGDVSGYFASLVILLPWIPTPAMSPVWPKMNA